MIRCAGFISLLILCHPCAADLVGGKPADTSSVLLARLGGDYSSGGLSTTDRNAGQAQDDLIYYSSLNTSNSDPVPGSDDGSEGGETEGGIISGPSLDMGGPTGSNSETPIPGKTSSTDDGPVTYGIPQEDVPPPRIPSPSAAVLALLGVMCLVVLRQPRQRLAAQRIHS